MCGRQCMGKRPLAAPVRLGAGSSSGARAVSRSGPRALPPHLVQVLGRQVPACERMLHCHDLSYPMALGILPARTMPQAW